MAGRRRRSGFIGWLVGLVVVLTLAWVGYWFAARTTAEAVVDRATSAPIAGNQLGCSGQTFGGFPLRLDFGCRTVTLAARGGFAGEIAGISATAPLYRPGHVSANLTSPLTLNAPLADVALTASWSLATAKARAGLSGLLDASGTFLSLAVENAGTTARLPVVAATADRATAAATAAGDRAYTFEAHAERLNLTRQGGRTLPEADLDLNVKALDFGDSLGTDPLGTLRSWLRRGGTAEVKMARIRTGGAVVSADGTLSLSPDGVVSGTMAVRFGNLDALAQLLETLRPGARDEIGAALAALSLMTVPVQTEDGPARETTLVITDGLVSVGIIPIGVLPALRF